MTLKPLKKSTLNRSKRSRDKTFCEFFAGIGLVREGLLPSGWDCIYANDISPKKQVGYEARFGETDHFHLGDVWNTDEVVGRIPGHPALATASFPCIDLSLAGHYRGFEGEHSSTFFAFANVLESLKDRRPPIVMVENVTGFLSSRDGKDFATAATRLSELGYWLDAFVLDACWFTPQSRPRVFVIGISEEVKTRRINSTDGWLWPCDEVSGLRPDHIVRLKNNLNLDTGWVTLSLPKPPNRTLSLPEIIDTDDEQEWWDEAEVRRHHVMMSDLHKKQVDEIIASGQFWVSTIFRRRRTDKMRAEVRFDGLAGCLRTPKGGSARQIVIAVDRGKLRMRWMNAREYGRLQGVPNFPLVGTVIQQLWGFADAVCVPAIAWIDQHILTPLYDCVSREGEKPCPTI